MTPGFTWHLLIQNAIILLLISISFLRAFKVIRFYTTFFTTSTTP